MNKVKGLYLGNYSSIDSVNHLLKIEELGVFLQELEMIALSNVSKEGNGS